MSAMASSWMSNAGEGLPTPYSNARVIVLVTCISCGRRWANPPTCVSSCGCGGDVVHHEFGPVEYANLRRYSDPRGVSEVKNV